MNYKNKGLFNSFVTALVLMSFADRVFAGYMDKYLELIGKIKPLFEKLGFIKFRNLRPKQSKVYIMYIMGFGLSP